MKKILLSLTALTIPASHAATVIDDFTEGTTNASITGVGADIDIDSGLTVTSTIGGTRVARAHNTAGPNSNSVTNTNIGGQLDWSVDTQTTGHFHLYYGYNTYNGSSAPTDWNDQAGGDYNDLNADFTGETGITVNILFADTTGGIRIGLISNRGEGTESVASLVVTNAGGAETLTFDFASFVIEEGGSLNIANIDQIIVEAAADSTSADWSLNFVSTVPEPSTALLGLVGLLGLARRRR